MILPLRQCHSIRPQLILDGYPLSTVQCNLEIYQDEINAKFGSKFEMPVVYCSQLISVTYGRSAADAALDSQVIKAKKLEGIAAK